MQELLGDIRIWDFVSGIRSLDIRDRPSEVQVHNRVVAEAINRAASGPCFSHFGGGGGDYHIRLRRGL
jgi:hypothetical protein